MAHDTLINVVAFVSEPGAEGTPFGNSKEPWVAEVTKEHLLAQYAGWESEVLTLLNVSNWRGHEICMSLKLVM